jgi:TatD DNase family protein
MQYDIHSHYIDSRPDLMQFLAVEASLTLDLQALARQAGKSVLLSVGIHPWKASNWDLELVRSMREFFSDERLRMVGEIGLDKACSVPFDVQEEVFRIQVELAEEAGKPILLHAVRVLAEILDMKRKHPSVPAWIIHGFRGGRQEAEQYVSKGFYLSFGPKFNREGLLACPLERLFLETDDSGEGVGLVYERVAEALGCPMETLVRAVEENFRSLFLK